MWQWQEVFLEVICTSSIGSDACSVVLTFIDSSVKHANLLTDCSRGILFTCCKIQNPPPPGLLHCPLLIQYFPLFAELSLHLHPPTTVGLHLPFLPVSCTGCHGRVGSHIIGVLFVHSGSRLVGCLPSTRLHLHPLGLGLGGVV